MIKNNRIKEILNFFNIGYSSKNYCNRMPAYIAVCYENIINNSSVVYCDAPRPWQMSFQQPATPAMEAIIDLHHNIMLVMIFIVIFISYILLRAIWLFNSNRRGVLDIPKLSKTRHYLSLEIIWTVIPMFILFWIAVPSFALLYSMDNCPKPELTFKVIGRQWYWSYESDFFIRPPFFNPEISEDNFKFNIALYSFINDFKKSFLLNDFNKANLNSLSNEAQEIFDYFLIPSILTNYHTSFNTPNLEFVRFSAITHYLLNYLGENFVQDKFESIFKTFTSYNLEKNSETFEISDTNILATIWDYLKFKNFEEAFEFNKNRALVFLDIKNGKINVQEGTLALLNFLKLSENTEKLTPMFEQLINAEFIEDLNNNILNEAYSILNDNEDNVLIYKVYSCYFQLNRSNVFLDTLQTIKLISDKLKFDKGSNSFLTFIRFLVDDNSYVFFKKALNTEQLSLTSFLKLALTWHKDLYNVAIKCSENSILVKILKEAYKESRYRALKITNACNLATLDTYGKNKLLFEYHLKDTENYLLKFFKNNRKVSFAIFYYKNFYGDLLDLKNLQKVCEIFKLTNLESAYFKHSVCCEIFFKNIFSDKNNIDVILSSFKSYHKIFNIMFNCHKDFAEFFNKYKHISIDYDSCILSDNDVYKIFEELCVSDDVLNLDELSTDFCGWYRLLEVDKRLVLPIKTRIRLLVTSSDVLHSWAVPSLGVKIDACPGRLNCVYVYIKRPGVFHGQCSELCGIKHGFMPIVVHGVPKNKFNFWVSSISEFIPTSTNKINKDLNI